MPCRTIRYTQASDWPAINQWLAGRKGPEQTVEEPVIAILEAVKTRGDDALAEYTSRFDAPGFSPADIAITPEEIAHGCAQVASRDKAIIQEAADNIRSFHEHQQQKSWMVTQKNGTILGQMVTAVDRAGLYVPGGQGGETPLISSLLMNAIPAQVAGVKDIVLVSPPRKDGSLNPSILAAADILGIKRIFRVGSAWAIAAMAYGTATVPQVDVIAGPGNIFVTTAKRLLVGEVGIDMIAGPSEIAILADESATPQWLAADLLSQAEHDTLASSLLISPDTTLLEQTRQALEQQLADLPRKDIATACLKDWSALIQVPDMDTGLELVNKIAPEHFELCVNDPWSMLGKVRNAGAVFMGHHTPEPVGDYFAGPNHVLPTLSTARFSSPLSVDTFCKKTSILAASDTYIQEHGAKIARLARMEQLEAHARSMEQRMQR
ncbi:MAG: histidinol dehydrogenase [Deltaproteobacteria bacterium]|nr:MAG: histidinol dehydrogenase [Deltaproteobacteria bacterium]